MLGLQNAWHYYKLPAAEKTNPLLGAYIYGRGVLGLIQASVHLAVLMPARIDPVAGVRLTTRLGGVDAYYKTVLPKCTHAIASMSALSALAIFGMERSLPKQRDIIDREQVSCAVLVSVLLLRLCVRGRPIEKEWFRLAGW